MGDWTGGVVVTGTVSGGVVSGGVVEVAVCSVFCASDAEGAGVLACITGTVTSGSVDPQPQQPSNSPTLRTPAMIFFRALFIVALPCKIPVGFVYLTYIL